MTEPRSVHGTEPNHTTPPAITIYHIIGLELGAGPFAIGLLPATYALFPLLLAVYTGRIIDRYILGAIAFALGLGLGLGQPLSTVLTYAGRLRR